MKTLKVIIPVLLAVSLQSQSQPYISFPTDNTYWSIDYTMPGPFGQIFHMARLYFVKGDTVINNVVYHKIFSGDTTTGSTPVPPIAFIREQNKQVYCRHYLVNFFNDEYVLYDFNLTVGDTFAFPEVMDSVRMVVTAINTEMTFAGLRKAYDFTIISNPISVFYMPPRWVEGIGDISNGVLPREVPPFDYSPQPLCFSDSTGLKWTWAGSTCWPLTVDEHETAHALTVSPNPCGEQIEISFPFQAAGESGIELFSAEGKRMLASSTTEQKLLLNTEKLPTGFYFLKLTCEGKSVFRKIVRL